MVGPWLWACCYKALVRLRSDSARQTSNVKFRWSIFIAVDFQYLIRGTQVNPEDAVDLGREALRACIMVGGPILAAGLLVGLAVGVLQAMTQVQDQSVSFVPKILIMLVAIGFALPWLSEQMLDYTKESLESPAMSLSGQSSCYSAATWRSKEWTEPSAAGQNSNVKVASDGGTSSMPTMKQPYSMPNMTKRPHSSMPMMRTGEKQPASPRIAESAADRNK